MGCIESICWSPEHREKNWPFEDSRCRSRHSSVYAHPSGLLDPDTLFYQTADDCCRTSHGNQLHYLWIPQKTHTLDHGYSQLHQIIHKKKKNSFSNR